MAVWESYTQLRQAEDVQDEIYNISPIDNPVASMSRTIRATGKIHEWTEDELLPAGKNARIEGDEATGVESTAAGVQPGEAARDGAETDWQHRHHQRGAGRRADEV